MSSAAVFDLDGTLVAGTSAERLLVPYLWRHGILGPRQVFRALLTAAALPAVGPTRALRGNKRYLSGLETEAVAAALPRFVTRVILPRINPRVLARVEEHRRRGDVLHLLTGAPDFLADAVAGYLGLSGWTGTELARRDGRFTGSLAGPHLFGVAKREALEVLAREKGLDLQASTGFADHGTDVHFLGCFGTPVAVTPDRDLRRHARHRGWEVLE